MRGSKGVSALSNKNSFTVFSFFITVGSKGLIWEVTVLIWEVVLLAWNAAILAWVDIATVRTITVPAWAIPTARELKGALSPAREKIKNCLTHPGKYFICSTKLQNCLTPLGALQFPHSA